MIKGDLRRKQIVDAVLKILSTEGWDQLTVRHVAEESKVSTGAMPHFLGTKQEMVTAAIRHQIHVGQKNIRSKISGTVSPKEKIYRWVDTVVQPDADVNPNWGFWLCMWGRVPFDPGLRRDLAPVYNSHASMLGQMIADGVADKQFKQDIDVDDTADQLVALVDGLILRCRMDVEYTPERIRKIIDSYIKTNITKQDDPEQQ